MLRLAAFLTCIALAGCVADAAQEPRAVERGASVTLAPGEAVTVEGTALSVRFVAVTEDSLVLTVAAVAGTGSDHEQDHRDSHPAIVRGLPDARRSALRSFYFMKFSITFVG
jgi:hypothetical protein